MSYYELRILARGSPPDQAKPHIRPASDRQGGSELFEAKDDDAAVLIGARRERQLGDDYIVSVYGERDGERVMIYPRDCSHA